MITKESDVAKPVEVEGFAGDALAYVGAFPDRDNRIYTPAAGQRDVRHRRLPGATFPG